MIEKSFLAEADKVHRVVDDAGIERVTARFDLDGKEGTRREGSGDDN